mmetsp:Transcript_40830/g.94721  ORF Transcript_40830/g.94721 Transcript_40830/m.94721 type:complete len:421 (-) Transcript_40830:114-1376(-)
MALTSRQSLDIGYDCLEDARRQGLNQLSPAPPSCIGHQAARDVASLRAFPAQVQAADADAAVEAAREASDRAARRTRSKAPDHLRAKQLAANSNQQPQSKLQRRHTHKSARRRREDGSQTQSPREALRSVTPLSSSILDDMRSRKDLDGESEDARISIAGTSPAGSVTRPLVLPPPPNLETAWGAPGDETCSWKSGPVCGSACATPAVTGVDSRTPTVNTDSSHSQASLWKPPISHILPPLPPVSYELRFWIEAMELAQKDGYGPPKMPNSARTFLKEPKQEADEIGALRQQVQMLVQERDSARSELSQLAAENEQLQSSAEHLLRGRQEIQMEREAEQLEWQRRLDALTADREQLAAECKRLSEAKVEEEEVESAKQVQTALRVDLRRAHPQWAKVGNALRAGAAFAKGSTLDPREPQE